VSRLWAFLTRPNTKWWQWLIQALVVLLLCAVTVAWVDGKSFGATEARTGPCAKVRPQMSRMACHFEHGDYGRTQ
jgi:hypothetical protein